jgi:hypothetical protein
MDGSDLQIGGTEQKELKLYVVGESSGDPASWSIYGSRKVVIAKDEKQACDLADCSESVSVRLLELCEPMVLMDEYYRGS